MSRAKAEELGAPLLAEIGATAWSPGRTRRCCPSRRTRSSRRSARGQDPRRRGPVRDQRGVRGGRVASMGDLDIDPRTSTSTAARSPSATRSARPGPASRCTWPSSWPPRRRARRRRPVRRRRPGRGPAPARGRLTGPERCRDRAVAAPRRRSVTGRGVAILPEVAAAGIGGLASGSRRAAAGPWPVYRRRFLVTRKRGRRERATHRRGRRGARDRGAAPCSAARWQGAFRGRYRPRPARHSAARRVRYGRAAAAASRGMRHRRDGRDRPARPLGAAGRDGPGRRALPGQTVHGGGRAAEAGALPGLPRATPCHCRPRRRPGRDRRGLHRASRDGRRHPVGAENRDTASDQRVRPAADLAVTVHQPAQHDLPLWPSDSRT